MRFFSKLFGRSTGKGEPPEFKALIEASMAGLRVQTEAHQGTWSFGDSERWDFSLETGELVFTFPDMVVRTPAQIIGTFDSSEGRWMWAWANSSIDGSLTRDAVRVREYGEQNHIGRLTTGTWPAE